MGFNLAFKALNDTSVLYSSINIFIEHIVMQQHHRKFTMVTSFGLLFRPLSEDMPFRIKEKLYHHLNVKTGRVSFF